MRLQNEENMLVKLLKINVEKLLSTNNYYHGRVIYYFPRCLDSTAVLGVP
jgi:hypothetical protein